MTRLESQQGDRYLVQVTFSIAADDPEQAQDYVENVARVATARVLAMDVETVALTGTQGRHDGR